MGIAYPGFEDFYEEGNAGNGFFHIPHLDGATLDTTLQLAQLQEENLDILQLATWNDFGEGTMFEPTWELGYRYLTQLQQYLGVNYGESDLRQIGVCTRARGDKARIGIAGSPCFNKREATAGVGSIARETHIPGRAVHVLLRSSARTDGVLDARLAEYLHGALIEHMGFG